MPKAAAQKKKPAKKVGPFSKPVLSLSLSLSSLFAVFISQFNYFVGNCSSERRRGGNARTERPSGGFIVSLSRKLNSRNDSSPEHVSLSIKLNSRNVDKLSDLYDICAFIAPT
jgi:hypothetical protein